MPTLDERFSKLRPRAKANKKNANTPNARGNRSVKTQFAVRLQGAGTAARRNKFVATQKEKRQAALNKRRGISVAKNSLKKPNNQASGRPNSASRLRGNKAAATAGKRKNQTAKSAAQNKARPMQGIQQKKGTKNKAQKSGQQKRNLPGSTSKKGKGTQKKGTQKKGTQKKGTQKKGTQKKGTQKKGTQKKGTQKKGTQKKGTQKKGNAKNASKAKKETVTMESLDHDMDRYHAQKGDIDMVAAGQPM